MSEPGRAGAMVALGPEGAFAGYASLFGIADQANDVVMPGAFRQTLRTRGPAGIRMLWNHDPAQPIGVWDEIIEDARGLYVAGRLDLAVGKARELHALMRSGAVDGLSIGFHTTRARRDAATGLRRLDAIDLWEVSIVTFPMLPQARVSTVKTACPRLAAGTDRTSGGAGAQRLIRAIRRAEEALCPHSRTLP
ncbi:MAG: HK97 family phage prohead protease [Proteobacteria bacterium]|nr:HK97 family phage prohead protease [Pseudomonadota bacterium]